LERLYRLADYAIVRTGGKQYRVKPGDTIRVESLAGDTGDTLELTDVLMVSRDGEVTLGSPTVPGAKVVTEIEANGRGKKIAVFKYKAKTRYRRMQGHRQGYTELNVTGISIE
jgi:large subunit ribosomal protein L21